MRLFGVVPDVSASIFEERKTCGDILAKASPVLGFCLWEWLVLPGICGQVSLEIFCATLLQLTVAEFREVFTNLWPQFAQPAIPYQIIAD